MKIVAYSKIPSATPFVHLGYLAASTMTTKPVQGLLLGGLFLLLAGLSVAGQRLARRRKSAQSTEVATPRGARFGLIGSGLLVAGIVAIGCAFAFGERTRVFSHPEEATADHLWNFGLSVIDHAKAQARGEAIVELPTQPGDYSLAKALALRGDLRERSTDGWNTPLILRAVQQEGQLKYLVVSAGPDRVVGTRDDITSEGQEAELAR
jgi:hypothetical protein